MMRLTHTHRSRVSNRLAVLAAFLLVAATVAGVSGPFGGTGEAGSLQATTQASDNPAQASAVRSAKANKGFKISLYLFRRN
jgi:hypothetical protein